MKKSKIIVPIIIIVIVLLMAGAAFAYVYTATDLLKSDSELFFKYFEQITAQENGFFDKRIDTYWEKKKQTAYENSGEITAKVDLPEEMKQELTSIEDILGKVNDLAIRFSGKVDPTNQKVDQAIEVDYGNNVILPINYRQDGNAIGLQTDELSKKYIAVRNENLKQLATNLGVEDISEIPDVLKVEETVEGISFTAEEIEQLKQIYIPVLQQNLVKENFSSIKTKSNESYTLELRSEQIKNIIIKMLEATKQNTLLIDKVNEIVLSQEPEAEKIEVSEIDDLIESINAEDLADMPSIKLTLVQSDKMLNQVIFQLGESKIAIQKRNTTETLSYDINCELEETVESVEANSLFEEEPSEPVQANIYFNVQYTGLDSLTDVRENYEFGFEVSDNEDIMKYDYKININTAFNEMVSIEELDDVAIFLNDYDQTQLIPFLTQVGTRLFAINKNHMAQLGLEEYENPLLYSNPITVSIMTIIGANKNLENNLKEQEITAFNNRFTLYVGENQRGSEVNALIKTVQNSNLSSAGIEGHFVKVTIDGIEISENVDSTKTYNVEAVYDIEGYITEMKVTTNNNF